MDKQLIEEDIEFLEDENQCLKDELEVSNTELKAAKALAVDMQEVKKLLAYFIYVDEQGGNKRNNCIPPAMLANRLGFSAEYGRLGGQYYEIALPSRNSPSLAFHQGPPYYDMERTMIPNVELIKR